MSSSAPEGSDWIRVRGARTHNLKGIDVDIPLEKLTVITGVSGSGKSSLAFDTLFAEGRRRYLATVSPQTRELLQRLERPDVDLIDGLPPTLGIQQQIRGPRRRTTLATIAEVYDYLRLLYARIGCLHCPTCRQPVTSQARSSIVEQALQLEERQKVMILAPVVRRQIGSHAEVFARIVRNGFVRARADGELVDAATPPSLLSTKPHDIEIVVDRLIMKEGIRSRLEESLDTALELGQGQCILSHDADGQWQDRLFSSRLACLECGTSFPSLEPSDFSFNSARGACEACHGLGVIVADKKSNRRSAGDQTEAAAECCPACTGRRLGPVPQLVLIDGRSISDIVAMQVHEALECVELLSQKYGLDELDSAKHVLPTTSKPESISASQATTVHQALTSSASEQLAARHILPEIKARLEFLAEVGLDYITLDRSGDSLSAGEFQRARLASGLGTQLTGACYIVDEPTAGLHPRDTDRLLRTLLDLRDQGNTVVVVEHDLELTRRADQIIEIGPGAGVHGGRLLAHGSPSELLQRADSITGAEWRRRKEGLHAERTTFASQSSLRLTGATVHNLKDVTIDVPLGGLVCITGVSGSGKTSLVMQTLVPAIRHKFGESVTRGGSFRELIGVESITRLIQIDQMPLGRSGRSTPATYSGVWDEVRKLFAKSKESRLRGFTARRFSLLHAEGRCPRCLGRGVLTLDSKSLFEWSVPCPDCGGSRFNRQTLGVRYRGMNVADVLDMSFEAAAGIFENLPRLSRTLTLFCELGLGYLKLGQPATTLSGGEAQRVKLARELVVSSEATPTLFVLDEPTAGLHASDVTMLLNVLRRLIRAGHSVLVIEHNLDLIATADWLIDIGPEAGEAGGRIIAAGPPVAVALSEISHTARALRQAFSQPSP